MVLSSTNIGGKVKFSSGYTMPPPIVRPRRVIRGLGATPKRRSAGLLMARLVKRLTGLSKKTLLEFV